MIMNEPPLRSQEIKSKPSSGSFRVRHSDTCLITGVREMGKTHLIQTMLIPMVGKHVYHRSPDNIGHLKHGYHHIIDDFDKIPIREMDKSVLSGIQRIAMAGRHSNTGLSIVVHHPTFTNKEFRLTPDYIFCFRQPSGAAAVWLRTYLGHHAKELPYLPEHVFIAYSGKHGLFRCQLVRQGQSWNLQGEALARE